MPKPCKSEAAADSFGSGVGANLQTTLVAVEAQLSKSCPAQQVHADAGSSSQSIPKKEQQDNVFGMHAAKNVDGLSERHVEKDVMEHSDRARSSSSATSTLVPIGSQTCDSWLPKRPVPSEHGCSDASSEYTNATPTAVSSATPQLGAGVPGNAPNLSSLEPFLSTTYDRLPRHPSKAVVYGSRHQPLAKNAGQRHSRGRSVRDSQTFSSTNAQRVHHPPQNAHGNVNGPLNHSTSLHSSAASVTHGRQPVPAHPSQYVPGTGKLAQANSHKPQSGPAAEGARDSSSSSHASVETGVARAVQVGEPRSQASATGDSIWPAIHKCIAYTQRPQSEFRPSTSSLLSQGSVGSQPDATESIYAAQCRLQSLRISLPQDNATNDVILPSEESEAALLDGADLLDCLPPWGDMLPPVAPAEILLACMQALPTHRQLQLQHEAFHLALAHRVQLHQSSV
jgi:hypothetical protein